MSFPTITSEPTGAYATGVTVGIDSASISASNCTFVEPILLGSPTTGPLYVNVNATQVDPNAQITLKIWKRPADVTTAFTWTLVANLGTSGSPSGMFNSTAGDYVYETEVTFSTTYTTSRLVTTVYPKLWTPSVSKSGTVVTFTKQDSLGSIVYRINGGSWNAYTGPVTASAGQTVYGKVQATGYAESGIALIAV